MRTELRSALCLLFLAGIPFTVQATEPAAALSVAGHRIGETFRDCRDACPEMLVIPPGHFQMGALNRRNDEAPVHEVHIGYVFAVSKYPVTRGQLQRRTDGWKCMDCG